MGVILPIQRAVRKTYDVKNVSSYKLVFRKSSFYLFLQNKNNFNRIQRVLWDSQRLYKYKHSCKIQNNHKYIKNICLESVGIVRKF